MFCLRKKDKWDKLSWLKILKNDVTQAQEHNIVLKRINYMDLEKRSVWLNSPYDFQKILKYTLHQ